MGTRSLRLWMPLVLLGFSFPLTLRADDPPGNRCASYEIVHHMDLLGAPDFWPGFHPGTTPIAIYDGTDTCLFRHPDPSPEFRKLDGAVPDRYLYSGRHESVTANTSVDLNGVPTATLMADPYDRHPTEEWAAIALHEMFHVFQGEHHPGWRANEANLFVFPVEDADLLTLRILETEALRRALSGETDDAAASWAAEAMRLRRERYGRMSEEFPAYERGTEMNEGLAQYIQFLANPATEAGKITTEPFAADGVRLRAYATGLAIARLLDRLSPDWKKALEADDSLTFETMLSGALEEGTAPAAGFSEMERDAARAKSASLIEDLLRKRTEKRKEFEGQPGWTLVLEVSDSNRLWPQGFDPVNVLRVSDVEVLHNRFLRLGNESGSLEVINHISLTEGFGPHPIFNGTRKLTVTGLEEKPEMETAGETVVVTGDGIRIEFKGIVVEESGSRIRLILENRKEENP